MNFPLAHGAPGDSPWEFHAHPDVWLLIILLVGCYVLALRRWGPTEAPDPRHPVSRRKAGAFGLAIFFFVLGAVWPVHDISEGYLLSVHMVQHMLFTFVAPPLLLAGMPVWLLRK